MGIVCKIAGHKWHKLPDGSDGCACERCGKSNPDWSADHDWKAPQPITDPSMAGRARLNHRIPCAGCGNYRDEPHNFKLADNCLIRCADCGYETVWHDFVDGACAKCGADESRFYRDLILSGRVGLRDQEEAPCEEAKFPNGLSFMPYTDHLRKVPDLAEVVAQYKPRGFTKGDELLDESAVKDCVYKLGEIARSEGDEAGEANRALYEIALSGPSYCKALASTLVCDLELASDPRIAEAAKRERERHEANMRAAEEYLTRDGI